MIIYRSRHAYAVFACVGLLTSTASAGTAYFVVAERPEVAEHRDSYVLPLSDPDHIAHARDLIRRGPEAAGEPIVVAKISPGADGINRDHLAVGAPEWNWHVSDVEGFADFTIELIDANPTYVRQNLSEWIDDTGGSIGFWSYTVVSELRSPGAPGSPPQPIPLPAALPVGLTGLAIAGLAGVRVRRRSRFGC